MTQQEKDRIAAYRQGGAGCAEIAQRLSLSVNTVKSFCRRNGLNGSRAVNGGRSMNAHPPTGSNAGRPAGEPRGERTLCPQCGAAFESAARPRSKRFCSGRCRLAWWHAHRSEEKGAVNRKCPQCGSVFRTGREQKYCSHACYIAHRFGGGAS